MALLPKFDFPRYFVIRSSVVGDGLSFTFESPVGNAETALTEAPNMADLLDLLPEFKQSSFVRMFASAMKLPRMFEFKAEPIGGKAKVSLIVMHPTKPAKTWSKDFDAPNISIEDIVKFKDLLQEGVEYQNA